jgi:hypothetical protein
MTDSDYGLAPALATEGVRFLIPSLCKTCAGRVMSFRSPADLDDTRRFYEEGGGAALAFSWLFVKDNILVQIDGRLPEATARRYELALSGLQ